MPHPPRRQGPGKKSLPVVRKDRAVQFARKAGNRFIQGVRGFFRHCAARLAIETDDLLPPRHHAGFTSRRPPLLGNDRSRRNAEIPDELRNLLAIRIRADRGSKEPAPPQGNDIAQHVSRPPENHGLAVHVNDGNRGFGTDPLHIAPEIFVQNDVPHDEETDPVEALHELFEPGQVERLQASSALGIRH